jgi:hypothetical protein
MEEKIQMKCSESLLDQIDQESLLKEIETKPDVQAQSMKNMLFSDLS